MKTFVYLAVAFFALLSIAAAKDNNYGHPAVIFVPGAFHKAKVYDKVVDQLKRTGYWFAKAYDMPSVGSTVGREADVKVVRDAAQEHLDDGRDVVLMGNSYGCTVIGEAVKGLPTYPQSGSDVSQESYHRKGRGRIVSLIYLAGYIPYITEVTKKNSRPDIKLVSPGFFRFDDDGVVYSDGDLLNNPPQKMFYNTQTPTGADYWTSQLEGSSFAALNATATYIPYTGDFRVVFVVGNKDNSVPPAFAQTYIDQEDAKFHVESGEWDHTPMLSFPDEVVELVRKYSSAEGVW